MDGSVKCTLLFGIETHQLMFLVRKHGTKLFQLFASIHRDRDKYHDGLTVKAWISFPLSWGPVLVFFGAKGPWRSRHFHFGGLTCDHALHANTRMRVLCACKQYVAVPYVSSYVSSIKETGVLYRRNWGSIRVEPNNKPACPSFFFGCRCISQKIFIKVS